MKVRFIPILLTAIAAFAASTWKVTLPSDVTIGTTTLKKGEYSVSVQNRMAIFKKGKQTVSVPVSLENNPQRFSTTILNLSGSKLLSIDIGGTDTMLIFSDSR